MTDEWNTERWNASCDILWEMIMRPSHEVRAVMREEKCCHELNETRALVLKYIQSLKK